MHKATLGVTAAILVVAGGAACLGILRVRATLREARREVSAEGRFGFDVVEWKRDGASGAGFKALPAAAEYTSGASVGGKIYLAGPGGISMFSSMEEPAKQMQAGVDLPAAEVVSVAVGRLRGEGAAELIAATQGEGFVLVRSDGGVRQIRAKDAAARDVTAVLPLASGDLLVGTRRAGLLVFDGKALRVFAPGFAVAEVTALAGDVGDFWVGTRAHGVMHAHAGEVESFGVGDGLPDAAVTSIAVGEAGVFVGTPLGVAAFRAGKLERVVAPGLFAHALMVEGETLLVATVDQGVHEVSLAPRSSPRGPPMDAELSAAGFFAVGEQVLAVGDGGVLRHERGGSWARVGSSVGAQGLTARNVTALQFSDDGRLWVGYFDRGLDVLDLQTQRVEHVEDDHVFCVNRIVGDPLRGTVDVATANGLVLFDPRKSAPRVQQVLTRRDGLISDQVTDVAFARDGMTLATPAGVTFFTPSGAQSLYAFQGLVNNHVYALAAERVSGRVMAGTLGGISVLDEERVVQNVTLKNSGLKRNWITGIVRVDGAEGAAWFVGTYGGGVVRMDAAGQVGAMEAPALMKSAVVNPNAMLVTPRHVLAGSLADGLLVFDRGSQRWTAVTAGLPSRNVTALAERGGEIYVGTENGVVRVSEARLP